MSLTESRRVPLSDKQGLFLGGYVDNVTNFDLASHFSPYLRNARIDGASAVIRPGSVLFATLTTGSTPKGIAPYNRANPTDSRIIVRHNQDTTKKLVSIKEDGTITAVDTSTLITSNNRMCFVNVGDNLYCMNGVDKYGKLNGVTYTNPLSGTIGSAITPSFGVMFNSSMFVSGWSTNPAVVYKSVGDNPDDFDGAGNDQFTFEDQITGLAANTQGLFYFTRNSISVTGMSDVQDTGGTISYITRVMNAKEGAVNHYSIVGVGSELFYLTPNNNINKIIRGQSINGFEEVELSQRSNAGISKILQSLDADQTASFGYFCPKENLIKRHLKTAGATFNDIVIIYDTIKDAFLVDSNKFFGDGMVFNGQYYVTSMVEPKVFKDEVTQTDDDSPIPFEYWTKEYYIGDPTIKKCLWECRTLLDINELAELRQEIWIDGALVDTKTVDKDNIAINPGGIGLDPVGVDSIGRDGEETEGEIDEDYQETYILRTKGNLNVKGKKFQWRFYNNTLAGKVRLKNISARIETLTDMATSLTS